MTIDVTNLENMEVLVPATLIAEVHGSSATESSAISAAVGAALRTVQAFLIVNRISAAGAPRVVYGEWSPAGVKFTAAAVVGASPSNGELENAANWNRVYDNKAIRMVLFRHKIA
jgi:hypothetical protein